MRKNEKKNAHEILEKVEHLIEEPRSEESNQEKPPALPPVKKGSAVRERALITYIALLFTVAFVLVLLSFLAQQRDISQLNENANSALVRAEKLQDENRDLSNQNHELELELQAALQEQEELREEAQEAQEAMNQAQAAQETQQQEAAAAKERESSRVKAYELLLQAQRNLDEENTEAFQKTMTELAAQADDLDTQGKALYQEFLAATAVPTEN